MFDFRLFFHLLARSFSFSRKSLRFFSIKRILVFLFIFPLYLFTVIVNHFFLLLDHIFFPEFKKKEPDRMALITGIPRSATTYVLNILARDRDHFTCFKFWELMFAPSILQKYVWLGLIRIDRFFGGPFRYLSIWIDRLVFGSFRGIHDIGLSKPEEDEVIFMYTFTSAYLSYFFPDLAATDKYLLFDACLPEKRRYRLMDFYKRFVQRHNHVFNRTGEKCFVSKNPAFVAKLKTHSATFPRSRIIYLLRSPYKTIPATISLNAHIYAATCRLPEPYPLVEKTREMLAHWYLMGSVAMNEKGGDLGLSIPFKDLTGNPKHTMLKLYNFLEIEPMDHVLKDLEEENLRSRSYKSPHSYNDQIGVDPGWIEKRLGKLFPEELRERI